MIKLIASDLDGTLLLNGAQQLSSHTLAFVQQLLDRGVIFVSASGRQYFNQYRLWNDLNKRLYFICENGALTMHQNKIVSKIPMDYDTAIAIANDIQNREGCEVTVNAKDTAYVCPKYHIIESHMRDVVHYHITPVSKLSQIDDEILKVAVFEHNSISNSAEYFKNNWSDKVNVAVSGLKWMDFMDKKANKGTALSNLQQILGISPDETYVFGDNFNDIEMLQTAKYSYAMAHAADGVKKYGAYTTETVDAILQEILKQY